MMLSLLTTAGGARVKYDILVPSWRVLYKRNVITGLTRIFEFCRRETQQNSLKPGCHKLSYQAQPSLAPGVMSKNSQ